MSFVWYRCSFWLNIQTASPPDAVAEAREEDTGRPPRPRATPRPPSPPPALEFSLDPQGAVTVISVPELLEDSRAHVESEPVKFELDLKALNVQQLLLQAAGQHATVQLGTSDLTQFAVSKPPFAMPAQCQDSYPCHVEQNHY